MRYGLLGRKLSHSYSPQIHTALAGYAYDLIEIEPENLEVFLQKKDFDGINVTIPYKKAVLPYCDKLSDKAMRLGSVNTIVKMPNGTLLGHNTDYFGFQQTVIESGLNVCDKKILVLGSGGAGVTVSTVLSDMVAKVITISRHGQNNYDNLHLHTDASIIVNATPVGMYPNNGASPIDLSLFPKLEGVFDLIYNPSKTEFLLQAEDLGIVAQNGLYMLVAQAKESAEYFIGSPIENEAIRKVYTRLKQQMENIVLIGMPGSGKTTIGKALSRTLNREFVDTDDLIIQRIGMSIPSYMKQFGLERFREVETAVIQDVTKQSGLVIATGGGCVTRKDNFNALRQNSQVIWIQREIKNLPTEGRPLSQNTSLKDMYEARKPLYSQLADITITNNGCIDEAVSAICKLYTGG